MAQSAPRKQTPASKIRFRKVPNTRRNYWFDLVPDGGVPKFIGTVSKRPTRPFDRAVWRASSGNRHCYRDTREAAAQALVSLLLEGEMPPPPTR